MADRWQPGDRILASQYAVTARWYLLHDRRVQASDQDVRILPAHSASEKLVNELLRGEYRWVVVGSTFNDWTDVDNRLRMIIQRWKVVYRSEEHGKGPSRILIYERPAGLTPQRPQRAPWLLPPGDWLPVDEP